MRRGTDKAEAGYPFRISVCKLHDYRPSHRQPEYGGSFDVQIIEHVAQVFYKSVYVIGDVFWFFGVSMAAQIETHRAVVFGKIENLMPPKVCGGVVTMNEYNRKIGRACGRERECQYV